MRLRITIAAACLALAALFTLAAPTVAAPPLAQVGHLMGESFAQLAGDPAFGDKRKTWKDAVTVVATSNLDLTGAETIDGVSVTTGDSVLCVGQTTGAENGIYMASTGAWVRRDDWTTSTDDYLLGAKIPVAKGTAGAGKVYSLTNTSAVTVGTTATTFEVATNNPLLATTETIDIQDDDSAASNGTALYANPIVGSLAEFYSTTAGDNDSYFRASDGGPLTGVTDNDSPPGVQVYFDEDAANADSRFLHASSARPFDWFVMFSDQRVIRIVYDASAASNGVALYIDDDASNDYERLLFVSPTDADGSAATDDSRAVFDGR